MSASAGRATGASAALGSTLADLTGIVHATQGTRPPPLVGCSVTLVGSSVYVFGGRHVQSRSMSRSMYRLDLENMVWSLAWSGEDCQQAGPAARYFHSANVWDDKIVIFGGEGYSNDGMQNVVDNADETVRDSIPALKTLGDVAIWDTRGDRWLEMPPPTCSEGISPPEHRYAHLGLVQIGHKGDGASPKSVLIVMGGQDMNNTYIPSVSLLDLEELRWIRTFPWPKSTGTYRSVLCTTDKCQNHNADLRVAGAQNYAVHSAPAELLVAEERSPLLLFSNFKFSQVRRDVELVPSPLKSDLHAFEARTISYRIDDNTAAPPGLRFPSGAILGRHFVVYGTDLSPDRGTEGGAFAIWALDLGLNGLRGDASGLALPVETFTWKKIDTGKTLVGASWNRAVTWGNRVVVIGHQDRDIATDYDQRQTNFKHVVTIDLEAFGVYELPTQPAISDASLRLGLKLLEMPFADIEIECIDAKAVACHRGLLETRWPWYKAETDRCQAEKSSIAHSDAATVSARPENTSPLPKGSSTMPSRHLPSKLVLPYPSSVVGLFVKYLAVGRSLHHVNVQARQQLDGTTLAALLVFASDYSDDQLMMDCKFTLYQILDEIEIGNRHHAGALPKILEAATLCGLDALQVRTLRLIMELPGLGAR